MAALLSYELIVNGRRVRVADALPGESLLFVLRERLGLYGAKNACEQGECGSCLVRIDRVLVCACLIPGSAVVGTSIETIEGLTGSSPLAQRLQEAFLEEGAVQCGFCTPGFILAACDLLERSPSPDDREVRESLAGNLCRCTGYGRILAAVARVVGDADEV